MTITRYYLTTTPQAVPHYEGKVYFTDRAEAVRTADRLSLCVQEVTFRVAASTLVHDGRALALFPELEGGFELTAGGAR